jgi:predicted Zn-dependent peptidase
MKMDVRFLMREVGRAGTVTALGLLLVAVVIAPSDAGQAAAPWKEKPEKFRLTTGEDCLYQKDGTSSITVVQLFVAGGKNAVPAGKEGLAYLATRATLEMPDFTVAQDIMAQATRMKVTILEDCTVISLECLSENLENAVRVASQIIQNPLFSGLRIDNIKDAMSIFARADEDDAIEAGHAAAMGAVFRGQGYGGSTFGSEASRKAIGKKEVSAFFGRFFTQSGVFFSVCTNVERAKVQALLEKFFAKFPSSQTKSVIPAVASLPEDRRVVLERTHKQSYVARAFVLPPLTAADFARAYLLEILLGTGPGSRLWDLRASQRLAYNVNARTTWTRQSGLLEVYLETENSKKDMAMTALDGVLKGVRDAGVTEEELRMTKTLARAQFLRTNESKRARSQTMGLFEVLGLGFDYLSGVFAGIDAVTPAEMNAFIMGVLDPNRSLLVVVGDKILP